MKNKIVGSLVSVSILISMVSFFSISYSDEIESRETLNQSLDTSEVYKYEKQRDELLKENLTLCDIGKKYNILWDEAFNREDGLVSYFDKKYPNLSDVDKLKMQISLLEYLNRSKALIDFDGGFVDTVFKESQLSNYLINNKKNGQVSKKENIIFLSENLNDLTKNVDFDKTDLLDIMSQIISSNFSD